MLSTLTWACQMRNDRVLTKLPIRCSLLEMILFKMERIYCNQPYLVLLFQAIFALGYYGLLRVGELTNSPHCIKAKDIHAAVNKDKIMLILYTSKTHNMANRPQKIKIQAVQKMNKLAGHVSRCFCPFKLVSNYLKIRGSYQQENELLFVFRMGSQPGWAQHTHGTYCDHVYLTLGLTLLYITCIHYV